MVLNSKEKGGSGVFDLFPIILVVLFGAFFLLNFGYYIKYLDILNDLDNISRKYMLIMESTGGMTEEDKEKMISEIKRLGINETDIDMTGTTFFGNEVQYGDEIFLKLTVLVPCKVFAMSEDVSVENSEIKREVSIFKCAIALS